MFYFLLFKLNDLSTNWHLIQLMAKMYPFAMLNLCKWDCWNCKSFL